MKITALWITKNEEALLARSMESVRAIADEMVVVDTGSTDETVGVAEKLGARIEHFTWISDFSAARNYALDCVRADIIIFLDADEWFEPALGPADRERLVALFTARPDMELVSVNRDDLLSTGKKGATVAQARILSGTKPLRYDGKIHEFIKTSSAKQSFFMQQGFRLKHSGYGGGVLPEKKARNAELLEASLGDYPVGSVDYVNNRLYFVRESAHLIPTDADVRVKVIDALRQIFDHPRGLGKLREPYGSKAADRFYILLLVTASLHPRVIGRRELRRVLIPLFRTDYPDFPGTPEIDLVYQAHFDLREDRLLRELEPAAAAARALAALPLNEYKRFEERVYAVAAEAALRRGDRATALRYAGTALRSGRAGELPAAFAVLMAALKGLPAEECISLINRLYDLSNPEVLDFLVAQTALDGFKLLHAYYLNKRIEVRGPVAGDVLRLLLITGAYKELAERVTEVEPGAAAKFLWMASVCGAPERLAESLPDTHRAVLGAYRAGRRLGEISPEAKELLLDTFSTVVLIMGAQAAEGLLEVYRSDPGLCLSVKALLYKTGGPHELLLNENLSALPDTDYALRRHVIAAQVATRRFGEALSGIRALFEAEQLHADLLHALLVVAEQGAGETGTEARALYDRSIALYDAVVDLRDVADTGRTPDVSTPQQRRALKGMTRAQYGRWLAEAAEEAVLADYLALSRRAAPVYSQNGDPAGAARCLARVITHGAEEPGDREGLASAFEALGNTVLPPLIRAGQA